VFPPKKSLKFKKNFKENRDHGNFSKSQKMLKKEPPTPTETPSLQGFHTLHKTPSNADHFHNQKSKKAAFSTRIQKMPLFHARFHKLSPLKTPKNSS